MVIEVAAEQAVHWMSPQDADERQVLELGSGSKLAHGPGTHALLGDGAVRVLSQISTEAQRRALISIAGNDNAAIPSDFQ